MWCHCIDDAWWRAVLNLYHCMAMSTYITTSTNCLFSELQWRHNKRDGVSNHRRLDCLLNRLFRRRWNKTSKLRFTGLCAGNSPLIGEFPAQTANNTANVSIWWLHHGVCNYDAGWMSYLGPIAWDWSQHMRTCMPDCTNAYMKARDE